MKQSLYLWWQLGSLRPNLLHSTHFYNLHLNVTNTVTISPSSDSLKIQCMPKLHGLQTVQTHILYLLNKRGYIDEPVTFTSNTTRLIRNRSLSALTTKVVGLNLKSKHLGFPKYFTNLTEISFTLCILYYHQITSIWHMHYRASTNVVMSWQHNGKHSNCSLIDWLFRVLFFSHRMWLQLLQDAVRRTKFQQELFTNSGRARVLEYSS